MKDQKIWIAVAVLSLPVLARALWFYQGISIRPEIATPDYAALVVPQPPLQTPAPDEEVTQYGGTVVVDYAHINQFQPAEIQSLTEKLEERGGKVEFMSDATLLENGLKYARSYVLISPSTSFTSGEIILLRAFVERGGRLAVFTDATRGMVYSDFFTGTTTVTPDAYSVNPLLANFGITVNNDYLYNLTHNEGNFRNVFFDDFGKAELTFGLKQVALYGTHSLTSDSGLVLLQGDGSTFSSVSDTHDPAEGGAAISEDGNVLAFGDFTFMSQPYEHVADNATLIANIADFLLAGKRVPSLANFPYVFDGSLIQALPASDVQMTAEMISALGRLQTSLRANNNSMEMIDEKPAQGQVLLLGTFDSVEEIDPIANRFDLTMDDFSEFVTLPGFGDIGRAGNGVLLFDTGKNGNTLVLLADTTEDLTSLIDILSNGSLDSCVLQGTVGVCSVGYGGSFSDGESFEEGGETFEEETSIPEVEPTPSG
jgi:hypothetical protein